MSVIFGIKEDSRIIIAGDRRGSDLKGDFLSDDCEKVTLVNDQLCFASAGNVAIGKAIKKELEKIENKEVMVTEDLLDIIKIFYQKVCDLNLNSIFELPFSFLIAGKGRSNKMSLIAGVNAKGKISAREVPMALYSPKDVIPDICNKIFVKNYKVFNTDFVEKTIRDISSVSNLVSIAGHKWIYNNATEKGTFYVF